MNYRVKVLAYCTVGICIGLIGPDAQAGWFSSIVAAITKPIVNLVSKTESASVQAANDLKADAQKAATDVKNSVNYGITGLENLIGLCVQPPPVIRRVTPLKVIQSTRTTLSCNGSPVLCNRHYNEITYVTSHNGSANRPSSALSLYNLRNCYGSNINDQGISLAAQFNLGVRATKTPVLFDQNKVYACHGLSPQDRDTVKNKVCGGLSSYTKTACESIFNFIDPCTLDNNAKVLSNLLNDFNDYIKNNPNEVLTLFVADQTGGHFEQIQSTFEASSVNKYLYVQGSPNQAWPTLKEMITSNKRLVVFVDTPDQFNSSQQADFNRYFNRQGSFAWSSPFNYPTDESLKDEDPSRLIPNLPYNDLWILQHFVTPSLAGNPYYAARVNEYQFLKNRVNKYINVIRKNPNFIWVDFTDLSQSGKDIFTLANELNGI